MIFFLFLFTLFRVVCIILHRLKMIITFFDRIFVLLHSTFKLALLYLIEIHFIEPESVLLGRFRTLLYLFLCIPIDLFYDITTALPILFQLTLFIHGKFNLQLLRHALFIHRQPHSSLTHPFTDPLLYDLNGRQHLSLPVELEVHQQLSGSRALLFLFSQRETLSSLILVSVRVSQGQVEGFQRGGSCLRGVLEGVFELGQREEGEGGCLR